MKKISGSFRNMVIVSLLMAMVLASLSACTDAKRAEFTRIGKSAQVTAISFGKEIYNGESTGKLTKKEGGYLFVEKGTNDTVQILGENTTYVIRYKK